MKKIKVCTGQLVAIDDEDADLLKRFKWRVAPNGYVYATIYLHRLVVPVPRMKEVNHINEDKLNNCKSNLEVMSHQQNCLHNWACRAAKRWNKSKSSKYVGVTRVRSRWKATLTLKGNQMYLGMFETEIEAAKAYNVGSKKFFGEGAYQNEV